uniref:Uncharacterized protein n=1 Tax=Rhizophora mucronata TaxID=61149 RepID=A0A2P2QLX3_RHIMU
MVFKISHLWLLVNIFGAPLPFLKKRSLDSISWNFRKDFVYDLKSMLHKNILVTYAFPCNASTNWLQAPCSCCLHFDMIMRLLQAINSST